MNKISSSLNSVQSAIPKSNDLAIKKDVSQKLITVLKDHPECTKSIVEKLVKYRFDRATKGLIDRPRSKEAEKEFQQLLDKHGIKEIVALSKHDSHSKEQVNNALKDFLNCEGLNKNNPKELTVIVAITSAIENQYKNSEVKDFFVKNEIDINDNQSLKYKYLDGLITKAFKNLPSTFIPSLVGRLIEFSYDIDQPKYNKKECEKNINTLRELILTNSQEESVIDGCYFDNSENILNIVKQYTDKRLNPNNIKEFLLINSVNNGIVSLLDKKGPVEKAFLSKHLTTNGISSYRHNKIISEIELIKENITELSPKLLYNTFNNPDNDPDQLAVSDIDPLVVHDILKEIKASENDYQQKLTEKQGQLDKVYDLESDKDYSPTKLENLKSEYINDHAKLRAAHSNQLTSNINAILETKIKTILPPAPMACLASALGKPSSEISDLVNNAFSKENKILANCFSRNYELYRSSVNNEDKIKALQIMFSKLDTAFKIETIDMREDVNNYYTELQEKLAQVGNGMTVIACYDDNYVIGCKDDEGECKFYDPQFDNPIFRDLGLLVKTDTPTRINPQDGAILGIETINKNQYNRSGKLTLIILEEELTAQTYNSIFFTRDKNAKDIFITAETIEKENKAKLEDLDIEPKPPTFNFTKLRNALEARLDNCLEKLIREVPLDELFLERTRRNVIYHVDQIA